jgi:hypothetical protein
MNFKFFILKNGKLIELENAAQRAKRLGVSTGALRMRRIRQRKSEGILIGHTFYYFKREAKNGSS